MENAPRTLIDQRERAGHTALFYAVTYGHYEAAKRLLHYGANPNFQVGFEHFLLIFDLHRFYWLYIYCYEILQPLITSSLKSKSYRFLKKKTNKTLKVSLESSKKSAESWNAPSFTFLYLLYLFLFLSQNTRSFSPFERRHKDFGRAVTERRETRARGLNDFGTGENKSLWCNG